MNRFYYFTGTGNTLDAAKRIAAIIGDTELVRITKHVEIPEAEITNERIGIFVPAYMGSAPSMVKKFIKKIKVSPQSYVFTVVTCGGMEVATHSSMVKILKFNGINVFANFTLDYPANNQTSYAPVLREQAVQVTNENESNIKYAANIIKDKAYTIMQKNPVMELMAKAAGFTLLSPRSDTNFNVTQDCVGCGVCQKVCPADNISIVKRRPEWKHKCERCTACLQLCPKKAIQFKNATKGWGRYHNPNISIEELEIF